MRSSPHIEMCLLQDNKRKVNNKLGFNYLGAARFQSSANSSRNHGSRSATVLLPCTFTDVIPSQRFCGCRAYAKIQHFGGT